MALPRIFVSIACYRDAECPHTLASLFSLALHPERVFAGVLWQLVPGDDDDCAAIPASVPAAQVRGGTVHANESRGACWARHQILAGLYQGEEFVLQIDSHMRFSPGWDVRFIEMLQSCPSPRAVLSSYPVPYTPPDQLDHPRIPVQVAKQFDNQGVLMLHSRVLPYDMRPRIPQPSAFIGAGCLFAPGQALAEVPYDPWLYFHGEEITMAARLWTHGWDLFTPNDVLLYHDYRNTARPRHWSDNRDWPAMNARAAVRLRCLLAREPAADPLAVQDIEHYGLGMARTLEEYEAYADLDFRRRLIGPRARDGRFPPAPDAESMARERLFTGIFNNGGWGCAETRSGPGSTLEATVALRRTLPEMLARLEVRSLLDAGCGDLNWIESCLAGLDLYLGIDISPAVIAWNTRLYGRRKGVFFNTGDVVSDALPQVDAIICRHVLTHLPNQDAEAALENMRRSGATYLLATCHQNAPNTDVESGKWRALDLRVEPFRLPAPLHVIEDGAGVSLCVWDMRAWREILSKQ